MRFHSILFDNPIARWIGGIFIFIFVVGLAVGTLSGNAVTGASAAVNTGVTAGTYTGVAAAGTIAGLKAAAGAYKASSQMNATGLSPLGPSAPSPSPKPKAKKPKPGPAALTGPATTNPVALPSSVVGSQ
jgi:hypothetical protein